MKESYTKELVIHSDPESCLDNPQGCGEALTGESAGWVLSSEITVIRMLAKLLGGKAKSVESIMTRDSRIRRSLRPHACADTLYTGTGRS